MAVLCNSCLVQTEASGQPTLWPMDFPREQRIEMESSVRPPGFHHNPGIHSTHSPANLHVDRGEWEDNLQDMVRSECCFSQSLLLKGEITCTTRAVGQPQLQVGRKTSAGLERESEIRLGISLTGAGAADWAAL